VPIGVLGAGIFTNIGPYATTLATMNSTGLPIFTVIEAGVLGPGSGRVLLFSDATPFADPIGDGFFAQSETMFLNSIQYLVPEPTTGVLAGFALLSVFAFRRARKR